ncbi:MAG: M1 family metallopeptidase [Bacteroidetes bacterium]|nr:M1 family metallopeptidase [Bacteroidota bacterium]
MTNKLFLIVALLLCGSASAQVAPERDNNSQFRDVVELPTPNKFRSATGFPAEEYFQQRADHNINITLNQEEQIIYGEETITYYNNSETALNFVWFTLDQNWRLKDSYTKQISNESIKNRNRASVSTFSNINDDFDGGDIIEYVKNGKGEELNVYVDHTIMRVDLDKPLAPHKKYVFKLKWKFNTDYAAAEDGRTGYEKFDDGNYLYTIAQFFPRLCVYNDEGWQTEQYIFDGEFALEFGNYDVSITVPNNHIVVATGELQNAKNVLTAKELKRFKNINNFTEPTYIVTPEEALAREQSKANGTKTWRFKASNVRDFAFASSPKFIWEAMKVKLNTTSPIAMSVYPKEGNPLWGKYGVRVIANALRVYSDYLFDYPYPVAIGVHATDIAMEYPMICFNGGRPNADGTYNEHTKQHMIGGILTHEIGHNYFPMVVNIDERRHCWFDESLNSLMEGFVERTFDRSNPSWWAGNPQKITRHMAGDPENISPIMTRADGLRDYGQAVYRRSTAGLTMLRETILGREAFDKALKEFANAWKFKHPTPADFFRTLESVSGQKLNWFIRGWYYTTLPVDISIDMVTEVVPVWNEKSAKLANDQIQEKKNKHISLQRDWAGSRAMAIDIDENLIDSLTFATAPILSDEEKAEMAKLDARLSSKERTMLESNIHYYELKISNNDGIVMPLILKFEFIDGTNEEVRLPAEIWMRNQKSINKIFKFNKELVRVMQDPHEETADINISNNSYPQLINTRYINIY